MRPLIRRSRRTWSRAASSGARRTAPPSSASSAPTTSTARTGSPSAGRAHAHRPRVATPFQQCMAETVGADQVQPRRRHGQGTQVARQDVCARAGGSEPGARERRHARRVSRRRGHAAARHSRRARTRHRRRHRWCWRRWRRRGLARVCWQARAQAWICGRHARSQGPRLPSPHVRHPARANALARTCFILVDSVHSRSGSARSASCGTSA